MADDDFGRMLVGRLIRETFSDPVNVTLEARLAVTKAVSAYVRYIGAATGSCAQAHGHPFATADDVIEALGAVELSEFLPEITRLSDVIEVDKGAKREKRQQAEEKRKKAKAEKEEKEGKEEKEEKGKGEK